MRDTQPLAMRLTNHRVTGSCQQVLLILLLTFLTACGGTGPKTPAGPGTDQPGDGQAVAAAFADTSLEQAVRQALAQPTGDLSPVDLHTLTSLSAASRGIVDLSGIEQLDSLTALDLSNNRITDLAPLDSLTHLQMLDLSWNQVSDLTPLTGLASLQTLALEGNPVADLAPLLNLPALTVLEVSGTPQEDSLSTEPLATLRGRGVEVTVRDPEALHNSADTAYVWTDTVFFPDRQIRGHIYLLLWPDVAKIDWNIAYSDDVVLRREDLKLLTYFAIGGDYTNPYAWEFDLTGFEHLVNLRHVYFLGAYLPDLSGLSSLSKLKILDLEQCAIGSLAGIEQLTALTDLSIRRDHLRDITALASLPHLLRLNLMQNQIEDLAPLMGLTSLVNVDISKNPLNQVSRESYIPRLRSMGVGVVE